MRILKNVKANLLLRMETFLSVYTIYGVPTSDAESSEHPFETTITEINTILDLVMSDRKLDCSKLNKNEIMYRVSTKI